MNDGLAVIIPHLSFSVIIDLLDSIQVQENCDYHIFIVNNGNTGIEEKLRTYRLTSLFFNVNQGVSRSWNIGLNKAIEEGYRNFLWLNDDIILRGSQVLKESLDKILLGTVVTTQFEHIVGWAFGYNYDTFLKLGEFDERFYPCFYEDNDMDLRIKESQIPLGTIAGFDHKHSQTTCGTFQNYKEAMRLIFEKKWPN